MKNLQTTLLAAVLACGSLLPTADIHASDTQRNPAARMLRDASLMLLREGNDRYAAGRPQHPNADAERRSSTVSGGQEPFATVLACSDSRGPVELIFDRGVGDVFVIRVAGNIAGESELASMEYGVGHLNTPVLVVLGHSKCGAVTAVTTGVELHGHLHILTEKIQPAAEKAKAESIDANDLIPRAIQANVWNTMERILRDSSVIREKVEAGAVHLAGAVYDLETGKVAWLGGHPAQDAIVALANQARTDAALAKSQKSFAPMANKEPSPATAKESKETAAKGSVPSAPAPRAKPSRGLAGGAHEDGAHDAAPAHRDH